MSGKKEHGVNWPEAIVSVSFLVFAAAVIFAPFWIILLFGNSSQ